MNEKLELKYKEMVRLAEISDEYAKSSFDDFKMLSALGALVAWKPLFEFFGDKSAQHANLLFIGFLAILFIIAFIGLYGLLKQAVVTFYLQELQLFEKEVRQELNDADTATFRVAEHWFEHGRKKQRTVAVRFYFLFYLVIIVYPSVILFFDDRYLACAYLLSALFVTGLHFNTTRIVYGESHSKQ